MQILPGEINELRVVLMELPPVTLIDVLYAQVVSPAVDHLRQHPPVVTVNALLTAAMMDAEVAIRLAEVLRAIFPTLPARFAAAMAMAERIRTVRARQSADPIAEVWVNEEPMINRRTLRDILRDLTNGIPYGVVYIHGPRGSGRSHSRHLIQHVAGTYGIDCFLAGAARRLEARTLETLYDEIQRAFGLHEAIPPLPFPRSTANESMAGSARIKARMALHRLLSPLPQGDLIDRIWVPLIDPDAERLRRFSAARVANEISLRVGTDPPLARLLFETLRAVYPSRADEIAALERLMLSDPEDDLNWNGTAAPLDGTVAEGAGDTDIAGQCAALITERLINRQGGPTWVIIDFSSDYSDRRVRPFLTELCYARADSQFTNCVLFVLGRPEHAAAVNAEMPIKEEVLDPLDPDEIEVVATAARERSGRDCEEAVLRAKVLSIVADVRAASHEERWHQARIGLKRLRMEVSV